MEVNDEIYGIENITEPVLIDLIQSPEFKRLGDISQLGMPNKYYFREGYKRDEHSLGVMVLLRRLGAVLEEQVAGLLHDISHTTFSHVIDWVFGNPEKEDYQDNILYNIIQGSHISDVLKKYNFDPKRISLHENFHLLERDAPSLCADRIDYTLRELCLGESVGLAKKIFSNLRVKNDQIVFLDKDVAVTFFEKYNDFQNKFWASDQAKARYHILSEALKEGLKEKIINLDDFNKTEDYLLNILENSENDLITYNLNLLKKGFDTEESSNGIELKKKFRYIDPEILVNGSYQRLSFLSPKYSKIIELEKEKSKLVRRIKIIPHIK